LRAWNRELRASRCERNVRLVRVEGRCRMTSVLTANHRGFVTRADAFLTDSFVTTISPRFLGSVPITETSIERSIVDGEEDD